MRCSNCGSEMQEGTRFCTKCGQKLEMKKKKGKNAVLFVALLLVLIVLIVIAVLLFNEARKMNDTSSKNDVKYTEEVREDKEDSGENGKNSKEDISEEDEDKENSSEEDNSGEDGSEQNKENEKALNAYTEFLNGTRGIYIPKEQESGLGEVESGDDMKYMEDILQGILETYLQFDESDETVDEIKYAYLDCGNDGLQELIVRFVGLDIYSIDDDSDLTYVIRYEDDKLILCHSSNSWARSGTEYSYYGCVHTGGSGGAGAYYQDASIIDQYGNEKNIYKLETLGGWWTSYVNEDAYNEVFGYSGIEPSLIIEIYTINGTDYHTSEIDPEYAEECETYVALCKQQGAVFYSPEEVEQAIDRQIEMLGIDEVCLEEREPEWQVLAAYGKAE